MASAPHLGHVDLFFNWDALPSGTKLPTLQTLFVAIAVDVAHLGLLYAHLPALAVTIHRRGPWKLSARQQTTVGV